MHTRTTLWLRFAAVLSAGLTLRLLFLHLRPPFSGDALVYGDIATNMLQHHRYAITQDGVVKETLIRLPGFPILVALCFSLFGLGNYSAILYLQLLLSLIDCCLLGLLSWRLMGERAGWFAFALAALCPFTANYTAVVLTETLALLCFTVAFFCFQRWSDALTRSRWNGWLLGLSVAISVAALLRPDRILIAAVLLPAILWVCFRAAGSTSLRGAGPAVLSLALVVLPLTLWGVRNWHVFHVVQPLAPKYAIDPDDEVALGFMRWYRTWGLTYQDTVQVYWKYDGSVVDPADLPSRAFDSEAERLATLRLFSAYNDESGSTPEFDARFAQLARERIAAHPFRYYVLLPVGRLANMWLQPRTELLRMPLDWWHWSGQAWKAVFSFGYIFLNLMYLGLAVRGFSLWKRAGWSGQKELAFALIAFVLLRSALLATLDNVEQRYTIDCFPAVLLLASFALARSSKRLSVD